MGKVYFRIVRHSKISNCSPKACLALSKSSGLFGFDPGATPVRWESYVVSIVNLTFPSGAWVRDGFSLEISYLEYEGLVLMQTST